VCVFLFVNINDPLSVSLSGYTGSAIMIHGICASIGCFAMENAPIERVRLSVDLLLFCSKFSFNQIFARVRRTLDQGIQRDVRVHGNDTMIQHDILQNSNFCLLVVFPFPMTQTNIDIVKQSGVTR
jgi:murein L,D-transpeptidase YafK